jgi:hypothetical protein
MGMLAKKTSKNQITLPKAIVERIPDARYFDVSVVEGTVVLKPVAVSVPGERARAVREKVRALGLTEDDVKEAIRWARRDKR